MVLEENWSIPLHRARDFLCAQPDITPSPQGFQFRSCKISLTPDSAILLDRWEQKRTILRIEGPEEEVHQIHRRFFLQFLSAGG